MGTRTARVDKVPATVPLQTGMVRLQTEVDPATVEEPVTDTGPEAVQGRAADRDVETVLDAALDRAVDAATVLDEVLAMDAVRRSVIAMWYACRVSPILASELDPSDQTTTATRTNGLITSAPSINVPGISVLSISVLSVNRELVGNAVSESPAQAAVDRLDRSESHDPSERREVNGRHVNANHAANQIANANCVSTCIAAAQSSTRLRLALAWQSGSALLGSKLSTIC